MSVVHVASRVTGIIECLRTRCPAAQIVEIPLQSRGGSSLLDDAVRQMCNAEILLADPAVVQGHVNDLQAKWFMSTWAGVDALLKSIDKSKPLPSCLFTRFGGCFGTHMAEFVVSQMISRERRFSEMEQFQREKKWGMEEFMTYRILPDLTLGIIGVGDIGKEIARAAKFFGMHVVGLVNREITPERKCPHVDQYFRPLSELPALLEKCDYVCNVLPSTPETRGILDGDILAHCKNKSAVLMNLGRGDVISESTVIKALENGWLRHAILDVFSVEPIPEESALWHHPNVTITPHVSAVSFAKEVSELFAKNLDRYLAGEPLEFEVDWGRGY